MKVFKDVEKRSKATYQIILLGVIKEYCFIKNPHYSYRTEKLPYFGYSSYQIINKLRSKNCICLKSMAMN